MEVTLKITHNIISVTVPAETYHKLKIQWNPSCEAIPFAAEKWPFSLV